MRVGLVATATLICMTGAALAAEAPSPSGPGASKQQGESLSEKLSKGKGVIKPEPGIDPRIVKPAPEPNPNTTPVLPPPSPNAK